MTNGMLDQLYLVGRVQIQHPRSGGYLVSHTKRDLRDIAGPRGGDWRNQWPRLATPALAASLRNLIVIEPPQGERPAQRTSPDLALLRRTLLSNRMSSSGQSYVRVPERKCEKYQGAGTTGVRVLRVAIRRVSGPTCHQIRALRQSSANRRHVDHPLGSCSRPNGPVLVLCVSNPALVLASRAPCSMTPSRG
jgi:hypothetical protein